MVGLMKFTKKVLKVIDKEGEDTFSRSISNCNMLQVVKLHVVNKGVDAEEVACLKLDNNRNGLIYRKFKYIYIFRIEWLLLLTCKYMSRCTKACEAKSNYTPRI